MEVKLHFQLQGTAGIRDVIAWRNPCQRHRAGTLSTAGPSAHHDICRQNYDTTRRGPVSASKDLHRRKFLLPLDIRSYFLAERLLRPHGLRNYAQWRLFDLQGDHHADSVLFHLCRREGVLHLAVHYTLPRPV